MGEALVGSDSVDNRLLEDLRCLCEQTRGLVGSRWTDFDDGLRQVAEAPNERGACAAGYGLSMRLSREASDSGAPDLEIRALALAAAFADTQGDLARTARAWAAFGTMALVFAKRAPPHWWPLACGVAGLAFAEVADAETMGSHRTHAHRMVMLLGRAQRDDHFMRYVIAPSASVLDDATCEATVSSLLEIMNDLLARRAVRQLEAAAQPTHRGQKREREDDDAPPPSSRIRRRMDLQPWT